MNLNFKNIHIIGIGGAGLNGIAHMLLDQGIKVTGAEKISNKATEVLLERQVEIFSDEDCSILKNTDMILVSSAVKNNHPVLIEAKKLGIPVKTRHWLWSELSKLKKIIAISGSHGKTSVSGMSAHIIRQLNLSYGYIVGIHGKGSGSWNSGDWMLIEADEYAHTFLSLNPYVALINNIDWDHVDIYSSEDEYIEEFVKFSDSVLSSGGKMIVNGDDSTILNKELYKNATTFGFSKKNDWILELIDENQGSVHFKVIHSGSIYGEYKLPILGSHSILNAVAASLSISQTGIELDKALNALKNFPGLPRRLEKKFDGEITVFDDYAHSPKEVKSIISTLKNSYKGRRIIVYFQPHTYSRIKMFMKEFADSLSNVDIVRIGNIYASRESKIDLDLNTLVNYIHGDDVELSGSINETIDNINSLIKKGDVLITLNAGDGYKVGNAIIDKYK